MTMRLLIGLACCLALLACSDDDGPTTPDSDAIATATIGPDGGSLGNDLITVSIPAGALDSGTLLEIFAEDAPLGSDLGTGVFRLDGLTGACDLNVSLATTTWVGNHVIQLTTPGSSTQQAATLTDGAMHASFQAAQDRRDKAAMPVLIHGMGEQVSLTEAGDGVSVVARVPIEREAGAEILAARLLAMPRALLGMGFEREGVDEASGRTVSLSRIDVVMDPRREAPDVRVLFDAHDEFVDAGGADATVVMSYRALGTATPSRAWGQACTDLGALIAGLTVQDENDPATRLAWLPLAYGRWVAQGWSPSDVDLPDLSDQQIRDLLAGVYHGVDPDQSPAVASFGPAMSAFLRWVTDLEEQGLDFAPALARASSADTPAPANLEAAFDGVPSSSWWHAFVRDLIDGQVVPVSDVAFIDPADGVFAIEFPDDSIRTFTDSYRQLSARTYSLRLDTNDIDAASTVRLSLDDSNFATTHLQLHVFKRLNGALDHLVSGQDLTIGDLAAMRVEGAHLLVVVSCSQLAAPYTDEHEAGLQIEYRHAGAVSPYSGSECHIAWHSIIEHIRWAGAGCPDDDIITFSRSRTIEDGRWNGYTYTGEFESVSYDPLTRHHGTIQVTMNDLVDEVELIQLEWSTETSVEDEETNEYLHLVWQGGDLARDAEGAWPLTYELTGATVVDHLTVTHTVAGSDDDCIQHLVSLEGEAGSFFTVGFAP